MTLRNYPGAVDQHGKRIHPAYQWGNVQLDTWNLVTVNPGTVVNGKTIARFDVAYDQPGSAGGYLDDIVISS